jgi:phospholipid transport system substrate-binding protein
VKGRFERLAPVIDRSFHLPLMTNIAAGTHWNEASIPQRQALVSAFRRMSVSTLATLFDGYSGEKFTVIGESNGPQGTLLVETRLTKSDNSTNDIAYVAKQIQNRWYLIDVIVDKGISELSVRRSEYRRILQQDGVDGLIRALHTKADELLATKVN